MKVYQMLLRGKCSVGDISAVHRVSDPRGHIRDLREKGVVIMDEWCKGSDGVRFKRYWIEKREVAKAKARYQAPWRFYATIHAYEHSLDGVGIKKTLVMEIDG